MDHSQSPKRRVCVLNTLEKMHNVKRTKSQHKKHLHVTYGVTYNFGKTVRATAINQIPEQSYIKD
jgi:hypothetical protein